MNQTPQWITARLAEDFNWWLESTSADEAVPVHPRSVLDPRQVAHLSEALEAYPAHGLRRKLWESAFTFFTLESEIEDGRVRLAPVAGEGADVFAVPVLDADGDGAYYDFLDALIAAQVQKLNSTGSYILDCTADDLVAELEMLAADRYFSHESRHCFDEINEILTWSPAEWDDASES